MPYIIKSRKSIFTLFFIFLFQILLILVQNTETQIEFSENNLIISVKETIIFINDSSNEIKMINKTNGKETIGFHDSNIKKDKEIINLNDSSFIIFGFNDDNNNLYYQTFIYSSTKLLNNTPTSININNAFDEIIAHHIHCNSKNYCDITLASTNNQIYIFQINLNNITPVPVKSINFRYSGTLKFIQCESFNIGNIFCIFGFIESNQNKISYNYINFDDPQGSSTKTICDSNCLMGRVAKLDVDSNKKFLVCYQQQLKIICQYYKLNSDVISEDDKYDDVYNIGNNFENSPTHIIILKIYNHSIFLKITSFIDDQMSVPYTILQFMSVDFKIKIKLREKYLENSINLFNDETNYYDFYSISQKYYLSISQLLPINQLNIIYFSRNNYEKYDFVSNHDGHIMYLDLDQRTQLNKNGINVNNDLLSINSNDIFEFGKPSDDILTNYFCYKKDNSISLVGKIQLKRCHESCNICNISEVGTNDYHFCTKCNNEFYPFYEITYSKKEYYNFNCYLKNSSEVSRAYFSDGIFHFCNESCNTCDDRTNCLTCKDKYYFKVDKNNNLIYEEFCLNTAPEGYYFDFNANILNKNNQNIQSVYKPCYDTCSSCQMSGSIEQNNCIECKENLTKYPFNEGQCLIDIKLCTNQKNFWKIDSNNITCISDCNNSIISEDENKGQCITDCKNYLNPYLKSTNYLSLTCSNQTYCIPYLSCNKIGFKVSEDGLTCKGSCEDYDIFNFTDIIEYINSIPKPVPNITKPNITKEEKLLIINRRKKRIESLKEKKSYEEVINDFGRPFISYYNDLFKKQSQNPDDTGFLVTSTTYDNFTVTIYPLDIEDYTYENLFLVKNLGFINFTKIYPDFIDYEVETNRLILVCVMEYFSHNYSINDLNYFIYSFDEISNSSFRLLEEVESNMISINNISNNINETIKYEIQYPLYNYKNEKAGVNKRNSEYLVDNIIQMNKDYPDADLSNISDPFYNDICFLFTSDVETDMTLNDRRKEYYVNYSLCEENCTLIKVINKDTNPRAVCSCEMKPYLIFNEISGKEYEIKSKSSPPIKSFLCLKQVFNIYIGKNPIFWIFIIILIYQIYLFIVYIKYHSKVIQEIIGLKDKNNDQNDNYSVSSSAFSKIIINENEKNKESSEQVEKHSAPVNVYNPPKRGEIKNKETINNFNTNDKDLISKSESTFVKENATNINNLNNKNFEGSEITYSDIKNGFDMIEVNNFIEHNTLMTNNFLQNPLYLEKIKKMKKIKRAMAPLKEEENKKYFQTMEDILYADNNKHKFKNKKNKEIANVLGGNDIINKNLIDNASDDEIKPRFPRNKIDSNLTSEKYRTLGSDHIIISGSVDNNKNKRNKLINDENSSEIKLKNENNIDNIFDKKKNTLAQSLALKEVNNSNNENDKKRIKTDDDLDNTNKIKDQLTRIGKGQKIRPISGKNKSQTKKNKKRNNDENKNNYNKINNIKSLNNNIERNNRNNAENIQLKNKNKPKIRLNKDKVDENDNSNSHLKNKSSEIDSNTFIQKGKIRTFKLKNKKVENKMINSNVNSNNKIDISNSNSNNNKKDFLYINKKEEKKSSESEQVSKISDSKRGIKFQEETEIEGDKDNKDLALEKLKLKRTQNLELLNDKVVSSVVEFLETENKELMIDDNYLLFYWKYFIKRELWFIVIRNKKNSIPYFIRYSCLGFCLSFLFFFNCLFFFESTVHKRYINALEGININISYFFKNEFVIVVYSSLIGCVVKMIIIKLLLYKVFKIGKNVKKLMKTSAEKGLTKEEVERLNIKREKYLFCYKLNLIFYFVGLLVLNLLLGYICTCYGGLYKNSINAFLFGIVFSIIFSFIFCAIICFLIVSLYKIGKLTNSKCVVSAYIVLSTLY